MRRSMALFAVGVAVAVAAAVVVVGMNSGGGESAGAAGDPATGSLPSGHPSIVADPDTGADTDGDTDAVSGTTIAKLERRRAKNPSDIAVLLDLGNAYFMRQHLTQAERVYDEALALEPGNAAAQVGRALVWHAQGDSKRAETALRSVLEAHPDNQDAHYSLAIVYFSSGRIAEAKTQWQAAAIIDPTSTTGKRSQSFVDLLKNQQSSSPAAN